VPGSANGAPITNFTATCVSTNGGVGGSNSHATSPITVPALTTGKNYGCTVDATNARGVGPESAKSPAVIVGAPARPAKPTVTRIAPGSVRVAFVPPANNGAPIISFTVVCKSTDGGQAKSTFGPTPPIVVTGLSPGATYTCTVRATNGRGTGPVSVASNAITA
jgi:titin